MRRIRITAIGGVLLSLLATATARPALAEQMTWTMTSTYNFKVQVAFYSQTRNHEWPGNGRAWDLNDYSDHPITLNCIRGEKICYGAWPTGDMSGRRYWGSGPGGRYSCSNCCYICGDADPARTLEE